MQVLETNNLLNKNEYFLDINDLQFFAEKYSQKIIAINGVHYFKKNHLATIYIYNKFMHFTHLTTQPKENLDTLWVDLSRKIPQQVYYFDKITPISALNYKINQYNIEYTDELKKFNNKISLELIKKFPFFQEKIHHIGLYTITQHLVLNSYNKQELLFFKKTGWLDGFTARPLNNLHKILQTHNLNNYIKNIKTQNTINPQMLSIYKNAVLLQDPHATTIIKDVDILDWLGYQ